MKTGLRLTKYLGGIVESKMKDIYQSKKNCSAPIM